MLLLQSTVATYLQSSGVGTLGANIFLGQLPSSPVAVVAVIAQGGQALTDNGPIQVRKGSLQVLIRDATYGPAAVKAESVFVALAGKWNITSSLKGRLIPDHEVGPSYLDTNNNRVFTLNFSVLTVSSSI